MSLFICRISHFQKHLTCALTCHSPTDLPSTTNCMLSLCTVAIALGKSSTTVMWRWVISLIISYIVSLSQIGCGEDLQVSAHTLCKLHDSNIFLFCRKEWKATNQYKYRQITRNIKLGVHSAWNVLLALTYLTRVSMKQAGWSSSDVPSTKRGTSLLPK